MWKRFSTLHLTQNMRSADAEFSKFLLKIGDRKILDFEIPDAWICENVSEQLYKDINNENFDASNRAILFTHNKDTHEINSIILRKITRDKIVYRSIDYAMPKGQDQADDIMQLNYPIEYLNTLKIPGMPIHKLEL